MSITDQKRDLRADQRRRLSTMTLQERRTASEEMCRLLGASDLWVSAKRIMAFASRPDEPDLEPLLKSAIAEGTVVALPRFNPGSGLYEAAVVSDWEGELAEGAFGIREPSAVASSIPLNQLDLVLVPGLAFDANGARLGRGKGFYDRLLTDVSGHLCGVLFEWQLVEAVPLEPHDRLMNSILTPAHWRLAAR